MSIKKSTFGILPNGESVDLYTISNGKMSLSMSTLGATATSLIVPSAKTGNDDILLGLSDFSGYANNRYYCGATVGRYSNRVINGEYTINGVTYHLSKNKPDCSLHGGKMGFAKKNWAGEAFSDANGVYIKMHLDSPDGDQGYPGDLSADLIFGLTVDNRLIADFKANINKVCPLSITNHSYFNLSGEQTGNTVLDQEMRLFCSSMVEVDEKILPTGNVISVTGTPYDFTVKKKIRNAVEEIKNEKIGGIDHCYVIDGENGILRKFVELHDGYSGRSMTGYTTLPGVQVYTANMLPEMNGKIGSVYGPYSGICLETQNYPDGPNHPDFPNPFYGPDRAYYSRTEFAFSW